MPAPRRDKILLLALTIAYLVLMITGGRNVKISFQVPHDAATAAAFVALHIWAIRL